MMSETTWYIRSRGRVVGPFDKVQLSRLRDQGKFARFHEVSSDRQTWVSAATLSDIFATGVGKGSPIGDADDLSWMSGGDDATSAAASSTSEQAVWYYSRGDKSNGPVRFSDLQGMAARGEIDATTLIWKEGYPNWISSRDVPGLLAGSGGLGGFQPQHFPRAEGQGPYHGGAAASFEVPPATSGLAVASLVLGLFFWLCVVPPLLSTVFGAVAIGQINRSRGRLVGKGMAIAGLVLGILGLLLWFLPILMMVGLLGTMKG
jgi:hypothetical protein